MARVTLNSNNSAVFISESPAFKTENETASLFGGVQNVSFSVPMARDTKRQVGSCYYGTDDIVRNVDVDLQVDYLFSPTMVNEEFIGLNIKKILIPDINSQAQNNNLFYGMDDKSYNFYIYNHPDQEFDALEYLKGGDKLSPNTGEIISFGNAYLSNYSISFSVGSLPTVSTTFRCSNMQAENYTGNIKSPAINLELGNNQNVGDFDCSQSITNKTDFFGPLFPLNLTEPVTSRPGDLLIELENLQVGGQKINSENHIINSMSINIPINRVDLHGLGSDYASDRKIQYPSRATISISSLVSKYEEGFVDALLSNEFKYEFSIRVKSCEGLIYSDLLFNDAKLENFQYSTTVNNKMQYSASFSFTIDNK